MIRNRILLKAFAIFFIIEMLASTALPNVALALTAGPTAPEYTSFEPVDTTDMVNLATGDFVYNIPLLEVPGPGGGYPLSLSYHAGIQPLLDASWVGLGWTLNPGAINRSVNGYADDFLNVLNSDRSFWQGGSTESVTIGVNVGRSGMASISAGLIFADDTYRGSGVGYYYGFGVTEGYGRFSARTGFQGGVSPYGDRWSSAGVSVGIGMATKGGLSAATQLGMSVDGDGKASATASVGVSYGKNDRKQSLVGASMSSVGGSSMSAGGISGKVENRNSGKVSTKGYNFSVDIPISGYVSLRLGKSYQRYWIDETAQVYTNGALYFPETLPGASYLDDHAFDVYDIENPNLPRSEKIPDEYVSGSFVDYDNYSVLGQGISGAIRPYHYKAYLLRQTKMNGDTVRVKSYPLGVNDNAHFRFVDDFSNRFQHDVSLDNFQTDAQTPLTFSFDPNRLTGESGSDQFDEEENFLPGSKHVRWYTNRQILYGTGRDVNGDPYPPSTDAAIHDGFIDCRALGFARLNDDKVGGYKIVNESGVTYHYALPVYSYDEYQYSGRLDDHLIHRFNSLKKIERYAYTWLLTAVTGPDYVDRNANGFADQDDWGYWVTFEYGKWTGAYGWRNPSSGLNKDLDQEFSIYSKGKKELYYLNSIRTQTHTAIFVKELRLDGKGVLHEHPNSVTDEANSFEGLDNGSYTELIRTYAGESYTDYAVTTLRLTSIYLLRNDDVSSLGSTDDLAEQGNIYYHSNGQDQDLGKNTHGRNVIDKFDIAGGVASVLEAKCLKKIAFDFDYSLCLGTPNSYRSALDVLNTGEQTTGPSGKLTLKSLKVYGYGGGDFLPPMKFTYDKPSTFTAVRSQEDPPDGGAAWMRLKVADFLSHNFQKGELFYLDVNTSTVYGRIVDVLTDSEQLDVAFYSTVSGGRFGLDEPKMLFRTKNPPFQEGFFDLWGYYKSDFSPDYANAATLKSENVKRMTTSTSARSVDVWSLREITTSLGSTVEIEYESDVYSSALKSLSNIQIKNIELVAGNKTKLTLFENVSEYGLTDNDKINLRFVTAIKYTLSNPGNDKWQFYCNDDEKGLIYKWYMDDYWSSVEIAIESVSGNTLIVDYNFHDRYPAGAICLNEQPDYKEEDIIQSSEDDCIPLDQLDASAPIFLGGEIISTKVFSPYGGGLRVKKITNRSFSRARSTNYEYFNGVTPYEPLGFSIPVERVKDLNSCLDVIQNGVMDEYRESYYSDIYDRFRVLFANARELPGPGVMYEWVRTTEEVEDEHGRRTFPGKSEYQFEVFSPRTIDISVPWSNGTSNPLYSQLSSFTSYGALNDQTGYEGQVFNLPVNKVSTTASYKTVIRDFTAIMGSLKRVILYDKNGLKMSETVNGYLHDDFDAAVFLAKLSEFGNQGVIEEAFADARIILNPDEGETEPDSYTLYGILSKKVRYPSVQVSETTINYKTGIVTKVENVAFDYHSGAIVKTRTEDGFGNVFVTETIPAHRKYGGMGLAYSGGKNMLTQEAGSTTYRVGQYPGILGADVQTWTNAIPLVNELGDIETNPSSHNVWRKHENYIWVGDSQVPATDLFPTSSFLPFDFSSDPPNTAQWQKTAEVDLVDVNSNALQAKDINGNYAATRMLSDRIRVRATIANAGYCDFAYSGAEDKLVWGKFGGNVSPGSGVKDASQGSSHTGTFGLLINAGDTGFTYEASKSELKNPNNVYRASVWVRANSDGSLPSVELKAETDNQAALSLNGPVESHKSNGWYQLNINFLLPIDSDQIKVLLVNHATSPVYVDDFRVHPYDATMTSYVYNEWGELSHILDANNLYTEFTYDDMGRLISTHRETFTYDRTKVAEVKYHYAGESN